MKLPLVAALSFATTVLAQTDLATLIQSQPDLTTLLSLIQLTNLTTPLSISTNITILAPTNEAFAALPRNIPEGTAVQNRNATSVAALLSNHVFQGYYPSDVIGNVPTFAQTLVNSTFQSDIQPFSGFTEGQYNGLIRNEEDVEILSGELSVSRVIEADIRVGDGIIIHKIDNVLRFGPPLLTYLPRAGLRGASGAFSTVNLGLNLGNQGAQQTGENVTDLTFFIPNDLAFENIASVLQSANESTLREVLSYHVLQNNVVFSPSVTNTSVTTVQGSELLLSVTNDGEIWANEARVVFPNVILFNGVAHIIDQVLNPVIPPPSRDLIDFDAPAAERVQFEGATSSSPLPFTTFEFSSEFQNPYTMAPLLTTYQAINTTPTATTTAPAVYTGGVSARQYAVEVVKVVVAVAAGGVVLGGAI